MAIKRMLGSLALAAAPLLLPAVAMADDGGPVLDYGRPEGDMGAEVAGVQAFQEAATYADRLMGFPQPAGMRMQPGMVGLRALVRVDSLTPPGTSELEVAGVQAPGSGDPEYLARREGWPDLGVRVSSGTVGLHALERTDSLYPSA